jgi:hypothetical protein
VTNKLKVPTQAPPARSHTHTQAKKCRPRLPYSSPQCTFVLCALLCIRPSCASHSGPSQLDVYNRR